MPTSAAPALPPLAILDLVPVPEGATPADALRHSRALVREAERLGYGRYWVAEHHNMTGIASAATSVVIGHLAGATTTIRVGAGGVMLPNHSPLVIAEQFGTLESLYPGRIDLGLGRAPGSDPLTARMMRRDPRAAEHFADDVQELQALLGPVQPGQAVQAVPGGGLAVPLWILGSSLYGAQLAAALGLPYAFASHFAPDQLHEALRHYRAGFRPSVQQARPYAMVGVNVVVAESTDEARRLHTSQQLAFINLLRGRPGRYPPPVDDIEACWSPAEKAHVTRMLSCSVVGDPTTVRAGLEALVADTAADELIVVTAVADPAARQRSLALLAELAGLTPRG